MEATAHLGHTRPVYNCSIFNFTGIANAHPLGMQSGTILDAQITVPSNPQLAGKARLYSDSTGWAPDAGYVTKQSSALTCFKGLPKLPKNIIDMAPVYLEVNFLRMKKLSYFIIQNSVNLGANGGIESNRKFVLSYRGFDGDGQVYGNNGLYAEVSYNFMSNVSIILEYLYTLLHHRTHTINLYYPDEDLYYGLKYSLFLLNIFKYTFGFSFVAWRCFFFTLFLVCCVALFLLQFAIVYLDARIKISFHRP